MSFQINLAKENFKFSGTHFTILGPKQGERLHGHNYYLRLTLMIDQLDPLLGMAFDFNQVKPAVRQICSELDEYILLPKNSPYLKVERLPGQVNVVFGDRHYSFPQSDVCELPLVNITSEELARYLAEKINQKLSHLKFSSLTVEVEETRGQGVSYHLHR